jgi:hypothetical protein
MSALDWARTIGIVENTARMTGMPARIASIRPPSTN